jgi:hypothetical protein
MGGVVAEPSVTEKTEVFTKDELMALRKALNEGRNGLGGAYAPPPGGDPNDSNTWSNDWENDIVLLGKFLRDLYDLLETLIPKRLPPQDHKRFDALLKNLKPNIDKAIEELRKIDGPPHKLFKKLIDAGLAFEALLAKLDEFRDRIIEGPVKGVLEMGDTILDSLISVLEILEPLKELKETIKNKIEYGADGEVLQLGLYPYKPPSGETS